MKKVLLIVGFIALFAVDVWAVNWLHISGPSNDNSYARIYRYNDKCTLRSFPNNSNQPVFHFKDSGEFTIGVDANTDGSLSIKGSGKLINLENKNSSNATTSISHYGNNLELEFNSDDGYNYAALNHNGFGIGTYAHNRQLDVSGSGRFTGWSDAEYSGWASGVDIGYEDESGGIISSNAKEWSDELEKDVSVKKPLNFIASKFSFKEGRVSIGGAALDRDPTIKLAVNGTIKAKKVRVSTDAWADYVFKEDYKLPSLDSVEKFIKENKHLPDVPSEKEVKENGLDMSEMMVTQMKKIEELTLHLIEQNKKMEAQNKKMVAQNHKIRLLTEKIEKIESVNSTN